MELVLLYRPEAQEPGKRSPRPPQEALSGPCRALRMGLDSDTDQTPPPLGPGVLPHICRVVCVCVREIEREREKEHVSTIHSMPASC